MYVEEIHFLIFLHKQSETVLARLIPVTLTFDPVTLKSIGFICYPGELCGPSLRMVDQRVLIIHNSCLVVIIIVIPVIYCIIMLIL